ncbi:MAG: DinB family protein [Marinomonas sp.]
MSLREKRVDQMLPVIKGNLEGLKQAKEIVERLSDSAYTQVYTPYLQSSIGQHLRHIIDNYFTLIQGLENSHIDYNWRRRGALVEQSRQTALAELDELSNWLINLDEKDIEQKLSLVSEVCLAETKSDFAQSNLHRELIFVASHSIHHIAIISMNMRLQEIKVPEHYGLAPATATFLRQQDQ